MHIKTTYKTLILLSLFSVLLLGCSQSKKYAAKEAMCVAKNETMDMAMEEEANFNNGSAHDTDSTQIERKLIKQGNVEFETADLEKSRKEILNAVKKFHGYVSNDNEYRSNSRGRITAYLEVRIPNTSFDLFLQQATEGVKHFDRKNIHTVDVTEEFLDIEARVKTKKELEQQLLTLLKRAQNIKDILEIRKELNRIREDIESIEGRLKYLQNQVAFATLEIEMYQIQPEQNHFGYNFIHAARQGGKNFIGLIYFLTELWPFIIIGAVVVILIIRRRKTKGISSPLFKKAQKKTEETDKT